VSREAQNLLIPFRRDKKRDFAVGSGEALLASKVRQALLTEGATARSSGELPWRTNFGAGLALLRHQRNDAALKELARLRRDVRRARLSSAGCPRARDLGANRCVTRERLLAVEIGPENGSTSQAACSLAVGSSPMREEAPTTWGARRERSQAAAEAAR
jgi:hypothetical protein